MMTAAINYREQRIIKRVVLAMGLEDHMHTREPTKSTAISDVAAAELRRAFPADAMAVQELTRKAYAQWVPVIGREPMPMKAYYDAALREHLVDLPYVDGRLAALIETIPQANHLLIENVAVLPALQGRGLGRRLMAHAEALAISLGLSEIRLYTNKDFAANVRLYLRLGYRVDREEPFMGGTTVYMSKPLGPITSDAGPAEDVESSSTEEFVPAPIKPTIAISDLDKLDIRVGMIETVEFVAASDKLVKLTVNFGDQRRSVLAGLRNERPDPKAELEDRQALFVVNLAPRKMAGEISEAMLFDIGYADGITPILAIPERPIPNGVRAG